MNSFKIRTMCLLAFVCSSVLIVAGTHIFVNNITPYGWKVECTIRLNKLTQNKEYKIYKHKLEPWAKHVEICEFNRDRGISEHNIFEHLRSLSLPDCTITFQQHIWKQLKVIIPTFGMEVGAGYSTPEENYISNLTRGEWEGFLKPLNIDLVDNASMQVPLKIQYRTIPGGSFHDVEYYIRGLPNGRSKRYAIPPSKKSPEIINGLAWNVYLMTVKGMGGNLAKVAAAFVPKMKHIEKPGIRARTTSIPSAIGRGYDFIILNEVWDNDARRGLLMGLKLLGYKYATSILGSGFLQDRQFGVPLNQPYIVNFRDKRFGRDSEYSQGANGTDAIFHGLKHAASGGVIIVSSYPIERTYEMIYSESSSEDGLAKKGVVYAQINKKGKRYHIFGTHLDTDRTIQPSQAKECAHFIDILNIPEDEPVLIGGDFNREMDKKLLNAFQANTSPLVGENKYSVDGYHNYLTFDQQRLDYLLYSRLHEQPVQATNEIRILTSRKPWSDWDSPLARDYPIVNVYDLSDHYAVYGYFKFPEVVHEKPSHDKPSNDKPSHGKPSK